jgi:hypothetical protein
VEDFRAGAGAAVAKLERDLDDAARVFADEGLGASDDPSVDREGPGLGAWTARHYSDTSAGLDISLTTHHNREL